jgi:hypothetical protein
MATALILINFYAFSRQKDSFSIFPYGTEFTIGYLVIFSALRVSPWYSNKNNGSFYSER